MRPSHHSIRLVLIDDHLLFRQSLVITLALCDSRDLEIVGETGDAEQGLQLIRETTPDVVLLDISMDGISGLDLAPKIMEIAPQSKILMLTMHNSPEYISQAFKAGCRGYTLKSDTTADLFKAIKTVAQGKPYLGPTLPRYSPGRPAPAPLFDLI